ncbi:MAG: TNT domain-containing protein [Reyranella sp.]
MGIQIYPTVPVAQEAAEPWPIDEHTIRIDEMFARRLDTEFAGHVRGLLHDPETGIAAQSGEAALESIAGALPTLNELKERMLSQAMGPRQRGILEPLIETRLDRAAGTLGRLAERATVEVDDASVADRIAGLNRDAAMSWHDPAYLQKLGRTAVQELRYQGERRGWDPAETDARVRSGLSDLYAGAVETAIRQNDLESAAGLYEHARPVIDLERQAAIDRRFVRAREATVLRDVDRDMAGIPIEPAGPPGPEVFESRAAELTRDDATDEMRARIAKVAEHAHRHAERQWNRRQAEAGIAALDWIGKNSGRSFLAIPPDIRDWLAPDQSRGLEAFYIDGRLRTDRDLFKQLDRQMVYEPWAFAALDLDRHRLSLDDEDHARFAGAQKAIAEGTTDPTFVRYRRARLDADRTMEAKGIDTDSAEAVVVHADIRDGLDGFETIEGHLPNGEDIAAIVAEAIERTFGDEPPIPGTPEAIFDPRNIILAQGGSGGPRGGGPQPPQRPPATAPQRPAPGPGHNRPPAPEVPPGLPSIIENVRRWRQPPGQPSVTPSPPDVVGPRAATEQSAEPTHEGRINAPSDIWPDNNGFAGEPKKVTLTPGTVVDRYGGPGGSYLSPKDTPPEARSMRPGTGTRPLNVYEVVKPFEVDAGPAAPHFNQPGGGTQYYLGTQKSVQDLIDSGHLRKLP